MFRDIVKERYEGAQTFLREGCLFLSLCSIAEEVTRRAVDVLDALAYCKKMKWVDEDNNMSVEGQCGLLKYLTQRNWERQLMKKLPKEVPDEMWTVEKWVNVKTGFTHFKRRYMDTLVGSVTVKEGTMTDYYCYLMS